MNDNIINLFDPNDELSGKLSPNYQSKMFVKDTETSNVISYAYAGLLKPSGTRNYILTAKSREAKELALKNFHLNIEEIKYENLMVALTEKYKIEHFRQSLLDTGYMVLYYLSRDNVLGVNNDGKGENKLGYMLMNIRRKIREEDIEKKIKEKKLEISYLYTAYIKLESLIRDGVDNLSQFIGKTPEQIIKHFNLKPSILSIDQLSDDMLPLLFAKEKLAEYLREKYRDEYNNNVLDTKKHLLLQYFINNYVTEYLTENSPSYRTKLLSIKVNKRDEIQNIYQKIDEERKMVLDKFYDYFTKDNLEELKNRLMFLFLANRINTPFNKDDNMITMVAPVKEHLKQPKEVIDEYTSSIKNYEEELRSIKLPEQKFRNYMFILDDEKDMNSIHFKHLIEIENFFYPSPFYYIYAKTMQIFKYNDDRVKENTIFRCHNSLLIDTNISSRIITNYKSYPEIYNMFNRLKNDHMKIILTSRAKDALLAKFEDDQLKIYLIETSPKNLIYNDLSDPYLGTGDKKYRGDNFIGVKMTEMRKEYMEKGINYLYESVITKGIRQTTKEIEKMNPIYLHQICENNKEKISWCYKKTDELLYILADFKEKKNIKYEMKDKVIEIDDVTFIIDSLYSTCSLAYLKNKISNQLPVDFEEYVKTYYKNKFNLSKPVIVKIWHYIYQLIMMFYQLEEEDLFDANHFNRQVKLFSADYVERNSKKVCESKMFYLTPADFEGIKKGDYPEQERIEHRFNEIEKIRNEDFNRHLFQKEMSDKNFVKSFETENQGWKKVHHDDRLMILNLLAEKGVYQDEIKKFMDNEFESFIKMLMNRNIMKKLATYDITKYDLLHKLTNKWVYPEPQKDFEERRKKLYPATSRNQIDLAISKSDFIAHMKPLNAQLQKEFEEQPQKILDEVRKKVLKFGENKNQSQNTQNTQNCIISSILNIIDKLKQHYLSKNLTYELDHTDLEFAYNVISPSTINISYEDEYKILDNLYFYQKVIANPDDDKSKRINDMIDFLVRKGYLESAINHTDIVYHKSVKLVMFFEEIRQKLSLEEDISRVYYFSKLSQKEYDEDMEKERYFEELEKVEEEKGMSEEEMRDLINSIKTFKPPKKAKDEEMEEEDGSKQQEEAEEEAEEEVEEEAEDEEEVEEEVEDEEVDDNDIFSAF